MNQKVEVAYITKWAKTRGIIEWRDALRTQYDALLPSNYGQGSLDYIPSKHWTTDKATAEERWRQAVETEAKRLKLAAKKYEALAKGAPVYTKEEQ